MLIRLGYEIAIECPQVMPVISLLEIHPERQADIKRQTKVSYLAACAQHDLCGLLWQCLPAVHGA